MFKLKKTSNLAFFISFLLPIFVYVFILIFGYFLLGWRLNYNAPENNSEKIYQAWGRALMLFALANVANYCFFYSWGILASVSAEIFTPHYAEWMVDRAPFLFWSNIVITPRKKDGW